MGLWERLNDRKASIHKASGFMHLWCIYWNFCCSYLDFFRLSSLHTPILRRHPQQSVSIWLLLRITQRKGRRENLTGLRYPMSWRNLSGLSLLWRDKEQPLTCKLFGDWNCTLSYAIWNTLFRWLVCCAQKDRDKIPPFTTWLLIVCHLLGKYTQKQYSSFGWGCQWNLHGSRMSCGASAGRNRLWRLGKFLLTKAAACGKVDAYS